MSAGDGEVKACPSALCEEGALLLGVMTAEGRLAYIQPPTTIDSGFVDRAKERGHPERSYRFSSPCVEGGCPQWTGDHCGIGELVAKEAPQTLAESPARLPNCAIRSSCRWHFEQGPAACAVCPLVVADVGGSQTYTSVFGGDVDPGGP
jgi:hypothetical protein